MFGIKKNEDIYVFESRPFWQDMKISPEIPKRRFKEIFGNEKKELNTPEDAIEFLTPIVNQYQQMFCRYITRENPQAVINSLYKIFDECYWYYIRQKEARIKIGKLGVRDGSFYDEYSFNRNIALNIMSAVNLWIENSLLYQENIEKYYDKDNFDLDPILFVDLYIYGLVSRILSFLKMNISIGKQKLFTGINIDFDSPEPCSILRYHPVVYYNPIIAGNQDVFRISPEEFQKCNQSSFGKAFVEEYGIDFLMSLKVISTFQKYMLHNGKYAFVVIEKEQFLSTIEEYTKNTMDSEKFFDAFVLTKEKIQTQLRTNKKGQTDPIIWIMGSNRYRHELCPFICHANDRITISYCALDQAKNIWYSLYTNGGMPYTNQDDAVTKAIGDRNQELSDILVEQLLEVLKNNYDAGFSEKDVKYKRIFGDKSYNYGDYDVVFYAKDKKELFLIEAKYFSDSLSNSGYITDYQKLFKKKGYYEHCRKRYELVLQEPEKMKAFIGVEGKIKVHFLFVSSKPLEIEFTDTDGIVSFPCLSIFEDYIKGNLVSEDGKDTVRPVHII